MKTILLLLLLLPSIVLAKFRAREHYDYHQFNIDSKSYTFRGFSNTINFFFYEKALGDSFGLGISTLGDNVENEDLRESRVGEKITLYQLDLEYKWFPKSFWKGVYVRHGFGYSNLDTDKLGSFHGIHYQQAIGQEIMFKHFGLALELSGQGVFYERGAMSYTIGSALGFHFYKYL